MFNHHRGLWGYTGRAADGRPVTVQSTGIGGPSAAVVVEELLDLGARALIRVGTCGALAPELRLGDLVVATEVLADDGASAALGAGRRVRPDAALTAALAEAAGASAGARRGLVVSTDLFYDDRPGRIAAWRRERAVAVEMEAAAVLRIAERREATAACVLAVTDVLSAPAGRHARSRLPDAAIADAGVQLGAVALDALARFESSGAGGRRPGRQAAARSSALAS